MMYQIQIPIGNMPINLVLLSEGTIAFVVVSQFGVIFDHPEGKPPATFYEDSFVINGETFAYNMRYDYKNIPTMLEWLQRQNLQEPI